MDSSIPRANTVYIGDIKKINPLYRANSDSALPKIIKKDDKKVRFTQQEKKK